VAEQASHQREPKDDTSRNSRSLLSPEFLRIVGVWSVIPTYLIAGAALGFLFDYFAGTWPFGLAIGLLIGLIVGVLDSLRLRNEFHQRQESEREDAD